MGADCRYVCLRNTFLLVAERQDSLSTPLTNTRKYQMHSDTGFFLLGIQERVFIKKIKMVLLTKSYL